MRNLLHAAVATRTTFGLVFKWPESYDGISVRLQLYLHTIYLRQSIHYDILGSSVWCCQEQKFLVSSETWSVYNYRVWKQAVPSVETDKFERIHTEVRSFVLSPCGWYKPVNSYMLTWAKAQELNKFPWALFSLWHSHHFRGGAKEIFNYCGSGLHLTIGRNPPGCSHVLPFI